MEWIGDERGDNLAIKSGLRIYTVDKYGTLISQRYKRNVAVQLTDGVTMTPIDGLADLRVGYTYSISQSEIVLGKLVESNLFGYRFLCINHKGVVAFSDIDYDEAINRCRAGDINTVLAL